MGSNRTKEMRDIIAKARDRGWRVESTSSGHYAFKSEHGDLIYTGGTPSDYRALRNIKAQLKRAERAWPQPPAQPETSQNSEVEMSDEPSAPIRYVALPDTPSGRVSVSLLVRMLALAPAEIFSKSSDDALELGEMHWSEQLPSFERMTLRLTRPCADGKHFDSLSNRKWRHYAMKAAETDQVWSNNAAYYAQWTPSRNGWRIFAFKANGDNDYISLFRGTRLEAQKELDRLAALVAPSVAAAVTQGEEPPEPAPSEPANESFRKPRWDKAEVHAWIVAYIAARGRVRRGDMRDDWLKEPGTAEYANAWAAGKRKKYRRAGSLPRSTPVAAHQLLSEILKGGDFVILSPRTIGWWTLPELAEAQQAKLDRERLEAGRTIAPEPVEEKPAAAPPGHASAAWLPSTPKPSLTREEIVDAWLDGANDEQLIAEVIRRISENKTFVADHGDPRKATMQGRLGGHHVTLVQLHKHLAQMDGYAACSPGRDGLRAQSVGPARLDDVTCPDCIESTIYKMVRWARGEHNGEG